MNLGHPGQGGQGLGAPGTPEHRGPGHLVLGPDQGPGQIVQVGHGPALGQLQALLYPDRQPGLVQGLKIPRQMFAGEEENADFIIRPQGGQGLGHLPGQPAGFEFPGRQVAFPGKERQIRGRSLRRPGAGLGPMEAGPRQCRLT